MESVKLFGKWSIDEVEVQDLSLRDYIAVRNTGFVPHSAGRWAAKRFRKAKCPVVERLTNMCMSAGRNTGKKMMAVRHVEQTFEVIHLLTKRNPLQVLVDACENGGPREDSTRVGKSGAVRRQAVDVSPLRRVNQALYLMVVGARNSSFRNVKTLAECLAEEIIYASRHDSTSYAIKKKDEIERVAASNR
ncbi:ribosomal protein S5/S7, eukaryotic/archaeal [Kipferlia bialata]|uniref:Ribosomal protein S5/S7, eukaryotic/archaeal n=1 Tax=Kipferlia bialata TaxID=797122 RepID=A0A9K3CLX2_9EUKA|nr:ribosomal protein S5/S7, eukaryotic/archaeal [Kipferlia bialata]|eukprot:g17.t1